MKIKEISVHNFRCFENLQINLNEKYTVLVGVNGAGKTSILDSVAIALGSYISGFDKVSGNSISTDDAHYKAYMVGSIVDMQSQFPVNISAMINIEDKNIDLERSLNREKGNTTVSGSKEIRKIANDYQNKLREGDQAIILPLVAYYGTARLWMQKKQKQLKDSDVKLSRQNGYVDCLDSASSEKQMLEWFKNMTYIELEEGIKVKELESVKQALKKCYINVDDNITDVEFSFKVKTKQLEMRVEKKDGEIEILPMKLLSDGTKGVLGLVADISYRMALLNPQLLDKSNTTPGIVLIDEIDMHLHPSWQKRIINDLIEIFPNIQFVFTTHSPSILSNVKKEHILVLDNKHVYQPSTSTYGKDVETILREIMHVEIRPDDVLTMLKQFYHCIDDEKLNEAKQKIKELEEILGPDASEVVSAKVTLELEEI